jgi:hypothetical protein
MVMPYLVGGRLVAPRYTEFWYHSGTTNAEPIFIGRILELKIGERLIRAVQGVRLSEEHQDLIDTRAYKDLFSKDGETAPFLQSVVLLRIQKIKLEEVLHDFSPMQPLYASPIRALPDDLARFARNICTALYVPEVEKIFEKLSSGERELASL